MEDNRTLNLYLSREAGARLLDILRGAEVPSEEKNALREIIEATLSAPPPTALEAAKESARQTMAQATDDLTQAQGAYAETLAQGSKNDQRAASATVNARGTKLQGAQAAYDAVAQEALEAKADSAEKERRAAYGRSQKAHDEALAALRAYEPLAMELFKLFNILTVHADLALADVEAADAARISPHAANAADHLKSVLHEQKLGHAEAVTKHVLAALRELELAAV